MAQQKNNYSGSYKRNCNQYIIWQRQLQMDAYRTCGYGNWIFLMAGGKSSNPNVFQDKDVYSTTRITIAPILIIAGLIIEIFAIMKKPK